MSNDDEDVSVLVTLLEVLTTMEGIYSSCKLIFPIFYGKMSIDEAADWVSEVEWFFKYLQISKERRVQLIAYRLKKDASYWWDWLQTNRQR